MAISTEYLSQLESIGVRRGFEFETKEDLLAELESEWRWLQEYWRLSDNDRFAVSARIDCLITLAEIGYELLARLTNEDWHTLIAGAKELHERKNSGYSPGTEDCWKNFRVCEGFGISSVDGCITRLCDKYSRFFSVYGSASNDKVGETAIDTLLDFSAYCLIAVCLLKERK